MKLYAKRKVLFLGVVLGCSLALFACSPSGTPSASSSGEGSSGGDVEIVQVDWSMDSDCASCHTEEAASMEDAALLASSHVAFNCVQCHTETDIASSHEGVTAAPDEEQQRAIRKAGRTMGTSEFCLQCHGSLEELAEKTSDVTMLKDANGTVVNPHAIPENPEHKEDGVQECYNCHWLHNTSPSPVSNCNSCHHQGVFECGTCHEIQE